MRATDSSGLLSYPAAMRVRGVLTARRAVVNSGRLSLAPGVTSRAPGYTQRGRGRLSMAIAGGRAPRLWLSGAARLAGTLSVNTRGIVHGMFRMIVAGSRHGRFVSVEFSGERYRLRYGARGMMLIGPLSVRAALSASR